MNGRRAACLLVSCTFVPLMTAPAFAQNTAPQAPPQTDGGLADIVVTAQRREENLQDVPVAVTAISSAQLDTMRVANVRNLAGLAPSLQINTQGLQSTPTISIRGIASGTSNSAVDPKVGIYLDGVYVGRTVGAVFDLADIERIEVLRGPQGTLFGRNATSGAISLVTSPPTGELGIKQLISYGNYDALRSRTIVNLPAFGPLSLKFAYLHDEIEGDVDNLIGGRTIDLSLRDPRFGTMRYADKLGGRNVDAFQAAARLDLGDVTADYHFDYTDSKTVGRAVQQLGFMPDVSSQIARGIFAFQPLFGGITNLGTNQLDAVANASSTEHVTVQGHSLTLVWRQSDAVTVKSITAFRKLNQRPNIYDLAATGGLRFTAAQLGALLQGQADAIPLLPVGENDSLFTLLTARTARQRQFSQELQFEVTHDKFELVAGGFYFHERAPSVDILGIFQPVANGVAIPTPFDAVFGSGVTETVATNDSMALYGQATYHLTDRIDLTGGLRYTIDDRETNLISVSGGQGGRLTPGKYKAHYNKINYTAILTWKPSDRITAYGKVSTGYVAGGILNAIRYRPESLTAYEVGVKSQLFDNRLRANIAAYYMDYKDLQTQDFINGVQVFTNAGKAKIKGIEFEFDAIPVTGLTLSGNLGYNDLNYKKFILNGVDVADVARPPYTSKWTARLSGQYDFPEFGWGGNAFARIEGRWRSKSKLTQTPIPDPALEALNTTKAYWLVDARAGIASLPIGPVKATLSGYAQNLLNKHYYAFGAPVITLVNTYDRGRTYGLELSVAF